MGAVFCLCSGVMSRKASFVAHDSGQCEQENGGGRLETRLVNWWRFSHWMVTGLHHDKSIDHRRLPDGV